VSKKYNPLSLGQLIWPSDSVTRTVMAWWMAICGGPTWTLNGMNEKLRAVVCVRHLIASDISWRNVTITGTTALGDCRDPARHPRDLREAFNF
jgi:hypothetical protein